MADLHTISAEPPSKDAVAVIERVLTEAREGRISSVAIAHVDREGCVTAEWSKPPSVGLLLGAVARLAHRLNLMADT